MTRTVSAAGSLPVSGLTESHSALDPTIEVVKAAVLVPDLMARACPEGSALPVCHVKVNEAGVGVNTGVCAKADTPATRAVIISRVLTLELSAGGQ